MNNSKRIKIILGFFYILLIFIFLWYFFSVFSIKDFTSYELIKSNRDALNELKNKNLLISILIFFVGTILWVMLLGFGSPIFLIGGFIFGKWIGTILVVMGLSVGATCLYILANYFIKDLIYQKFYERFSFLIEKFKKNEFLYFVIYRAIGGIPFFLQNLIPTLFNISLKNYFFGSVIGLAPQLFIGVSLGAGINKIIDSNDEMPNLIDMLITPDIYLPIFGFAVVFILAFLYRKKFFNKN